MHAMVLEEAGKALKNKELEIPKPNKGQVLVKVHACAVCRTDLHVIDGELPNPKLPLIPGHEVVGVIVKCGPKAERYPTGTRVGIPWLGWTCGECSYCKFDRENLCDHALFTGYTLNGGYAEFILADERFCFAIPEMYSDAEAAPLLCAGLIGFRALRKTADAHHLGIYGFGAAAHIVAQVAHYEGKKLFAFTRPGDEQAQRFAKEMGAIWTGDSTSSPPEPLDAAIIFAPAGELVPLALKAVRKGGIVVCGGIHMSDIPSFPYRSLWEERTLCSVANLTRQDGIDFFQIAPKVPVRTTIETFHLNQANEALERLRSGKLRGAAVLTMN